MPRKPKDDVAATTTITLRLTPDDRERIDRLIQIRAADLPERSMSALLRRLIRDAEEGVLLRLSADDRALLGRLVSERTADLARLGVYEANVTPASVVLGLIRDAAKAKALTPTNASSPAAPSAEPVKLDAAAKAPPKGPATPDAAAVHAALMAALQRDARQSDIARKAGIDPTQVSRFKTTKSGLSPENLAKLAAALDVKAR